MYAEITPLDTVFFRDGRSFTMGEETWGASRFPPPPSVVYGALRTRYFAEHPDRLEDAASPDDPTGEARLTAFHLRENGTPHFPVPRDLVHESGQPSAGRGTTVVPTQPAPLPEGGAALGSLPSVLTHPRTVESVRGAYLPQGDLWGYLQGRQDTFTALDPEDDDLVHNEPKIGIRMDRTTRAADDGQLYRIGLRRLGEDVSFGVGVESLPLEEDGLLKLGGESKPARYETVSDTPPVSDPPEKKIGEASSFRLYLATPAIFEQGWLPGWIDPETLRGQQGKVTVHLQAAAVGKPGAVGGWDMEAGAPKPMSRTVPAGSVYYFAIEDGTAAGVVEAFHNTTLSDRRGAAGFGRALVGGPV